MRLPYGYFGTRKCELESVKKMSEFNKTNINVY
jgi:hypothetical protein